MLGEATSIDRQLGNGWARCARNLIKGDASFADPEPQTGWECAARSEAGRRRAINEDAYLMRPAAGLWAVADGMGGHEAGDHASQEVMRRLDKVPVSENLKGLHQQVQDALLEANHALRTFASEKGPGVIVGSTIVVFLAKGHEGCVIWAGDSRLYRWRAGELQQLTEDHAWHDANTPDAAGQRAAVSRSNIITRAIGAYPQLKLDTCWLDIQPEDRFLLCTDGLDKELQTADIATVLAASTRPESNVDALITAALDHGGRDKPGL